MGSGVQKPERRLASNSKEDQAKRQAYRPVSQRKALQDEFEQVKKERDEAKQELADEKDRNVKLEQDHRYVLVYYVCEARTEMVKLY